MSGLIAKDASWFEVTENGLIINDEFTEQQWKELGEELSKNSRSLMWLIGDWLLAGESEGYLPRGKLDEACERFGIAYDTASRAKTVCSKVESRLRSRDLSWHRRAFEN